MAMIGTLAEYLRIVLLEQVYSLLSISCVYQAVIVFQNRLKQFIIAFVIFGYQDNQFVFFYLNGLDFFLGSFFYYVTRFFIR